jgi:hypothetical protein
MGELIAAAFQRNLLLLRRRKNFPGPEMKLGEAKINFTHFTFTTQDLPTDPEGFTLLLINLLRQAAGLQIAATSWIEVLGHHNTCVLR